MDSDESQYVHDHHVGGSINTIPDEDVPMLSEEEDRDENFAQDFAQLGIDDFDVADRMVENIGNVVEEFVGMDIDTVGVGASDVMDQREDEGDFMIMYGHDGVQGIHGPQGIIPGIDVADIRQDTFGFHGFGGAHFAPAQTSHVYSEMPMEQAWQQVGPGGDRIDVGSGHMPAFENTAVAVGEVGIPFFGVQAGDGQRDAGPPHQAPIDIPGVVHNGLVSFGVQETPGLTPDLPGLTSAYSLQETPAGFNPPIPSTSLAPLSQGAEGMLRDIQAIREYAQNCVEEEAEIRAEQRRFEKKPKGNGPRGYKRR